MKTISPFARYVLRRLLSQYVEQVGVPMSQKASYGMSSQVAVEIHDQMNLRGVLASLDDSGVKNQAKLQELETLLLAYHSAGQRLLGANYQENIKQRIYCLLGLNLGSILPKQMPPVLQEDEVTIFRFYHQQQVCTGLLCDRQFYGQIYQVNHDQRLQALKVLWALAEQTVPALLTIGILHHTLWVNVRSPYYSLLSRQAPLLLQKFLTFYEYRQKFRTMAWRSKTYYLSAFALSTAITPSPTDLT